MSKSLVFKSKRRIFGKRKSKITSLSYLLGKIFMEIGITLGICSLLVLINVHFF